MKYKAIHKLQRSKKPNRYESLILENQIYTSFTKALKNQTELERLRKTSKSNFVLSQKIKLELKEIQKKELNLEKKDKILSQKEYECSKLLSKDSMIDLREERVACRENKYYNLMFHVKKEKEQFEKKESEYDQIVKLLHEEHAMRLKKLDEKAKLFEVEKLEMQKICEHLKTINRHLKEENEEIKMDRKKFEKKLRTEINEFMKEYEEDFTVMKEHEEDLSLHVEDLNKELNEKDNNVKDLNEKLNEKDNTLNALQLSLERIVHWEDQNEENKEKKEGNEKKTEHEEEVQEKPKEVLDKLTVNIFSKLAKLKFESKALKKRSKLVEEALVQANFENEGTKLLLVQLKDSGKMDLVYEENKIKNHIIGIEKEYKKLTSVAEMLSKKEKDLNLDQKELHKIIQDYKTEMGTFEIKKMEIKKNKEEADERLLLIKDAQENYKTHCYIVIELERKLRAKIGGDQTSRYICEDEVHNFKNDDLLQDFNTLNGIHEKLQNQILALNINELYHIHTNNEFTKPILLNIGIEQRVQDLKIEVKNGRKKIGELKNTIDNFDVQDYISESNDLKRKLKNLEFDIQEKEKKLKKREIAVVRDEMKLKRRDRFSNPSTSSKIKKSISAAAGIYENKSANLEHDDGKSCYETLLDKNKNKNAPKFLFSECKAYPEPSNFKVEQTTANPTPVKAKTDENNFQNTFPTTVKAKKDENNIQSTFMIKSQDTELNITSPAKTNIDFENDQDLIGHCERLLDTLPNLSVDDLENNHATTEINFENLNSNDLIANCEKLLNNCIKVEEKCHNLKKNS